MTGAKGLSRADLDIAGLDAKDVLVGRFQLHMRRDPDGRDLDLMLQADQGGKTKQVRVYAVLSHGDAFAGLLRGAQSWPEAATAWRAQGGKAKFSQLVAPGLDSGTLLSPLY